MTPRSRKVNEHRMQRGMIVKWSPVEGQPGGGFVCEFIKFSNGMCCASEFCPNKGDYNREWTALTSRLNPGLFYDYQHIADLEPDLERLGLEIVWLDYYDYPDDEMEKQA